MSGMGSAVCKAFRVDIAQCELWTDRGCYRQEIGQVVEEGLVFVLNTMGGGSTFCLQRIWAIRVLTWGEIQLKFSKRGNEYKHTVFSVKVSTALGLKVFEDVS